MSTDEPLLQLVTDEQGTRWEHRQERFRLWVTEETFSQSVNAYLDGMYGPNPTAQQQEEAVDYCRRLTFWQHQHFVYDSWVHVELLPSGTEVSTITTPLDALSFDDMLSQMIEHRQKYDTLFEEFLTILNEFKQVGIAQERLLAQMNIHQLSLNDLVERIIQRATAQEHTEHQVITLATLLHDALEIMHPLKEGETISRSWIVSRDRILRYTERALETLEQKKQGETDKQHSV